MCALGRDNSYVCQKTSGKMEQQNVFSSQSNNNSTSSDDDDEDDDVASTHSGTTLKQSTPSFTDPQYVNVYLPQLCRLICILIRALLAVELGACSFWFLLDLGLCLCGFLYFLPRAGFFKVLLCFCAFFEHL